MVGLATHEVYDRIHIGVPQSKLPRFPPRHRLVFQHERDGHAHLKCSFSQKHEALCKIVDD